MMKKHMRIAMLALTSRDSPFESQTKIRVNETTKMAAKLKTAIVFLLMRLMVKYEKMYETAEAAPMTTPLRKMLNSKSANIRVGA